MDEEKYLSAYYENYDEDKRLTSKHGSIEYLTTIKYIEKYLHPNMQILEVGAGTGRYCLHFAHQGYKVNSIELVEHNIEIMKTKVLKSDDIDIQKGNALDLSLFNDNTFDVTLVLGPLYHLFTLEDKEKAIAEAIRVTKKGGTIYFAYLTNDSVIISWGLLGGKLAEGMKDKIVDDKFRCLSSPKMLFEMTYVEEFSQMMTKFNVEHLHTVATDGITQFFRAAIDSLSDEMYEAWVKYHFATCERKDLIGYSSHVIEIYRKK